MIAYREPLSFFLVLALSASSIVFANSENADGELSLLESVSWTEAIEDPSSTGAMISYYSKHPTSVPFFFPRLISIFEFMDIGDPKFCTLKQLSKNYPNFLKRDLKKFTNIVLHEIKRALKRGDRVELRGFGIFSTNTQKARISRNPKTGEKVNTPEKKTIHFKMSKDLFKKLNNNEE